MVISRIRVAAKAVAQAAAHGGGHHDHIHTKIVPREIATAIVLGIFCKSIFLDYLLSTPAVLVTDAGGSLHYDALSTYRCRLHR
jgi:hypothetical protein